MRTDTVFFALAAVWVYGLLVGIMVDPAALAALFGC
jgi:hypothetical protein